MGNWSGITTELKSGNYIKDKDLEIVDLPGIYSLKSPNAEEKVTREYIGLHDDVIINIVDSTNLVRNLFLTKELIDAGKRVVVGLNFYDVIKKKKAELNLSKLESKFGVKFFPISAMKNEGIDALIDGIFTAKTQKKRVFNNEEIVSFFKTSERAVSSSKTHIKPDDIFLGKYTAIPVFLLFMAAVFFIVFGSVGDTKLLGLFLEQETRCLLDLLVDMLRGALENSSLPLWFISLFLDGILSGVNGVLAFFPQILLMFFFLSVMEDTGYMARIALIFDKWLGKIGLNGRAVLPFVMGFGCTVPAVMTASATIEKSKRDMVIALIPYLPCGAKLPLFVILSNIFFGGSGWWIIFLMYGIGIIFAVIVALFISKIHFKGGGEEFLMELPPYRTVAGGNVVKLLYDKLKGFVKRVGSMIVIASVVVWALSYFTPGFTVASELEESLFAYIGKSLVFLFYPLGFSSGEYGFLNILAVFSGFMAKEAIVSTLFVLSKGNIAMLFTPLSALSFMLFNLLICPCVSSLFTMYKEMDKKSSFFIAIGIQIFIAYGFSLAVYNIGSLF